MDVPEFNDGNIKLYVRRSFNMKAEGEMLRGGGDYA
jgi:hypothetical protein